MAETKYTVLDTREITSMTPAGSVRKAYRVWIQTDRGASGTVDVSSEEWKADTLKKILSAKATELDMAFTLGE